MVLIVLLLVAAYLVLVERKFLARLQIRYGPNRAGKFGLLQPFADSIKMMLKEDHRAGGGRPHDIFTGTGRGGLHRPVDVCRRAVRQRSDGRGQKNSAW